MECRTLLGPASLIEATSTHAPPRADATVGLVPTRRNRFGALDITLGVTGCLKST